MTAIRAPGWAQGGAAAIAVALLGLTVGAEGLARVPVWIVVPAAASIVIAGVAFRRGVLVRPGWLLLTIPCLLAAAWLAVAPPAARDAEAWTESQRAALGALLQSTAADVDALRAAVASLEAGAAESDATADADLLDVLRRDWRARGAGGFPLALALWRDGERVAWTDGLEPFPPTDLPGAGEPAQVRRGRSGRVWRGGVDTGRGHLEWQARLTTPGSAVTTPHGDLDLRTSVLFTPEPRPVRWQGDDRRGLRASNDVVLDPTPEDMELPVLRVTVSGRPRATAMARDRARRLFAAALCLGAALGGWAAASWRGGRVLLAVWAARLAWTAVDLFHWWPVDAPGSESPRPPGDLLGLVDPTYFATAWGFGLFSSTLDALITGGLMAVTVLWIARRADRRATDAPAGRLHPWRDAAAAVAAAAALLIVWNLGHEIAVNAHPRLIGPHIPFRAVTFWGLHLALLTFGGGVLFAVALLLDAAGGRRRGLLRLIPVVGAAIGVALLAHVADLPLGVSGSLALPLLLVLATATSRLVFAQDVALRRLAWLLPVFAAVTWNYLALAHAYRGVEDRWLDRKIDEITTSREDWVQFLMEDLLSEMAADEAVLQDAPGAHADEAADLWRDWPAYALWRSAGLGDLGIPCRVEVLGDEGQALSRFASGQFRDPGYEIVDRGDWVRGHPVSPRPDVSLDLFLQTEQRRFATGDEWVLRGEVARLGSQGWIALELPVRTGRVRTMRDGLQPSAPLGGDDAYSPRLDVDRPLILLRAAGGGWETDDASLSPDRSPARLLADGVSDGVPMPVRMGRSTWRCVWRAEDSEDSEDSENGDAETADGILLGLEVPGLGDRLLDLSRLVLLDLLLIAACTAPFVLLRIVGGRWRGGVFGLQERILTLSFLLGLLPLLMAGTFIDRISREWLTDDARRETREGLETAREQLQGLLAEQARALAASDYISDLLASRLAGHRPLGPYAARQAMVFSSSGELLLDETLSDLDEVEARLLLEQVRTTSLVVMRDDQGVYLGTVIPVDLAAGLDVESVEGMVGNPDGPAARPRDGFFFYRQRLGTDLLIGLGEVIQGEAALYVEGEAILASHADHVFAGRTDLILTPELLDVVSGSTGGLHLVSDGGRDLSWTGLLTLPVIRNTTVDATMHVGEISAVLSASFPARGLDFAAQRERTVLFLAGLATLIFLLATVLGLALAWRIFDPVRVLVTATRRLAAGDFEAPLPPPSADELGTLGAAFAAMRDDLRGARDDLAERERFLAGLLERVPVGVIVFDRDDRTLALNPAAAEILEGSYARTVATPEDRAGLLLAAFRATVGDAAEDVAGPGVEAELVTPDRGRTLRGRLAPLVRPGGDPDRMIVFEDVTEFLETKRLAINAQLARQVAHEVKNPLTPIQLSVQFLQQAWRDGADDMDRIVDATVAQVLEQVELLRRIATEFSLLGRPEALVRAAVDPRALVREVLDRYRPAADDDGFVVRDVGDDPPPASAHAESLAKVIANLMENSLQAVGDDGRLELDLSWTADADEVTLVWRDNGPGLPDDVADRLFDLYFSTKSHGTGLGLPICRNLLSRMQGRIALANRRDGVGAEATVTLRRADDGEGGETA